MQSLRERADEGRRCVHLSQAYKSQHSQDDHDKSYDVDDVVHWLLLGATTIGTTCVQRSPYAEDATRRRCADAHNSRAAAAFIPHGQSAVCDAEQTVSGAPANVRTASPPSHELEHGVRFLDVNEELKPMNAPLRNLIVGIAALAANSAMANVIFFESDNFQGRQFRLDQSVQDFAGMGFNDRAQSAIVDGDSWELCVNSNYGGGCSVLAPGRYRPSAGCPDVSVPRGRWGRRRSLRHRQPVTSRSTTPRTSGVAGLQPTGRWITYVPQA